MDLITGHGDRHGDAVRHPVYIPDDPAAGPGFLSQKVIDCNTFTYISTGAVNMQFNRFPIWDGIKLIPEVFG